MFSFASSLIKGFKQEKGMGWKFEWKDGDNTYELWFEPLLWDMQFYVALYKNQQLMTDKVVVKPGFIQNEEEKRSIREIRGNITKLKKEMKEYER